MKINRCTKHSLAVGLALAAAVGLAGCGQNSLNGGGGFKDLKHVNPQDPDKAILINNVDKFPNITIVCIDGVALVSTTRDAAGALQHFDALDKICPGYTAAR